MEKKLLIIGYVWPEPNSSAAGSRMLQLIDVFLSENYNITFASPCAKTQNAFDLDTIGVTSKTIALNDPSFDDFVKTLHPQIVMFDRFMMEEQFGWRVAEQCPNAIRILDTEDLHFLRKGRQQALKDKRAFDKKYLFNDVAKREIASIYRCDLSLIISKSEMEILKNDFKVDESLLLYLPFLEDEILEHHFSELPRFEEREHFITIGNFLHPPNYDVVLYLKEAVWPLIRNQLPKAELHVYGAYGTEKVTQLQNEKQGFLIKGFAQDVNEVMQNAKVCLAPIRFGAGLKGKFIDAMKNGTPIVTTKVGAEGMVAQIMACGSIGDTPEDIAEKAVKLYQDNQLWSEKHKVIPQIFNTYFNKNHHKNTFLDVLSETLDNLEKKRQNNFIGQMLVHHTLQSTKYLSKWIEEKNK
ncbi:glycosyltransferase [Hyunsoonleella flava]|uniref:Glycosyltransferase n=1 Tax=Hyunsoonleella flava TaxID=2527939 RepID=A0A4Q9FFY6_9FLAO|nr:glycosyltransferase family 4 protein [Hyunsoonleella flava]TBN04749.1 glycosyltransferase [Hyunsoonleella flava]